jgi:uncharacterized cupin superfamily protein
VKANLASSAPHIRGALTFDDLADWGEQPGGQSKNTGRLLFKGPNNSPEVGVWVCTPGTWPLSIPRDEFCHFTAGRATYTRDDGEVIEVTAGTCVHFPAGWTGTCTVHETIRNTYMLS